MFRDRPGQIFADRLAAGLAANGTYKIVNPADLPAPSAHPRDDAGETELIVELLSYLRKRGDVQAVIVGSIEAYQGATYMTHYPSYRYGYYRPYYRHYPYYGGYWYHDYSDYVYSVRNEATVAIYSRIIRVADGETLAATPGLVSMTMHSYGYPAQEKTLQLLDRSTDAVVEQLLELFAIVPKRIKVDPDKVFRIASGRKDDTWTYEDEFGADDEKMFVVVRLPEIADRNAFRLIVSREGDRESLSEIEFMWDSSKGEEIIELSPGQLAQKGGGAGDYVAEFKSRGESVMKRKFEIKSAGK
jgi:hypothetical protein